MAGQTPEVIVPVGHQSAASACGPSCGASCCDDGCGVGHRLRDRLGHLRGRFQRNDCCQETCDPCARSRGHGHRNACDSCDPCGNGGFLARIRGMFHRDRGCCADTCCNGSAHPAPAGGTIQPSPAEPLKEQPKKLPKGGTKEASIITPPTQPIAPAVQEAPALQEAPAPAPALQQNSPAINATPITPAIAPRIIEGDVRNPF
jgi:hypothetical protein